MSLPQLLTAAAALSLGLVARMRAAPGPPPTPQSRHHHRQPRREEAQTAPSPTPGSDVLLAVAAFLAALCSLFVLHLLRAEGTPPQRWAALANALAAQAAFALTLRRQPRASRQAAAAVEAAPGSFEALSARSVSRPSSLAPRFDGFWQKDDASSDSLGPPMDLLHMPFLLRQAVRVIVGLDIKLTDDTFHFNVCSLIGWFKIREAYPTSGAVARLQRRDLRGSARGRCAVTPEGVHLSNAWDEPYVGCETSLLTVSADGQTLTARSSILLADGKSCSYTTVYRKKPA